MTSKGEDWSWTRMDPGYVPPTVDMSQPSVARMYDYYLGGKDHYEVDRAASEELLKAVPSTRELAINNRRFLQRAVRYLAAEGGIRQFLDHGSGLPTQDNVHQIAQGVDPEARVMYVDNDPIVLAHGRALLADNDRTTVITADMRDPDLLDHREARRLFNLDEPMGILFVSVLHCIPDRDRPEEVVRRVMDRVAPGSFLVFSHLVSPDAAVRKQVTDFMDEATGGTWGRVRTVEEIAPWLDGLEPVQPGYVEVSEWRPEAQDRVQETMEWFEFAGVARKPHS